jgi:TRAP-type C4-dicarboxylate transport system permease large subunit
MGWLLAIEQIPQDMARALPDLIDSSLLFMLAVMASYWCSAASSTG